MSDSGVAKRVKDRPPSSYLVVHSDGVEPSLEGSDTTEGEGRTVFVVVALSGSPDYGLNALEECYGHPDEVHVVTTEEQSTLEGFDSVSSVQSPGDLTGLSARVGSNLGGAEDTDVYMYFDDITCLLQYTDVRKAYRFFNTLVGRLHSSGAVGYFEMTPVAHDEKTYATIKTLFDEILGD